MCYATIQVYEFPSASDIRLFIFLVFSFTRYAVINSHWRTRSALRGFHFKEDHNVRSPFTRKFQSELAIYGVVYGRTSRNSLSKCTQIRSSPQRRVTARDLLFDLAPLPRFLYLFFFSPTGNDNPKRTILLWATNYIWNQRDSLNGIPQNETNDRRTDVSRAIF